ncbi:MAG: glycosyltransferase family 9 protein [Candidatus Omnitrophica bacterium]|nr:glycosyltransferase family 9 protein [Candidatus Omnitrophota bacterium]
MFSRLSSKSKVEKILLVSLTNIGDVILTFPVFDVLRERFPEAEISVVVGPKARSLLEDNPHVYRLYVYDKRASVKEQWRWLRSVRSQDFDLVVDLRNSMMPFLVKGRVLTRPVLGCKPKCHMKDKHMGRLDLVLKDVTPSRSRLALYVSSSDEKYAHGLLKGRKDYVVLAPGAADDRKRWSEERFAEIGKYLMRNYKAGIVIVGDKNDAKIAERLLKNGSQGIVNIAGQTNLPQLGAVLKGAKLAITNDSGIMHMASYLNIPVIALFGPTDPECYGPWSGNRYVLRQGPSMEKIQVADVCSAIDDWFHGHAAI